MRRRDERGASMIEFAILLPLLLLILIGMIDMGRLFLAEAMVTNAAREGARIKAMGYGDGDATTRVNEALPEVATYGGPATATFSTCPSSPSPTDFASAVVSLPDFEWLALDDITSLFGASLGSPDPTSTGTMRCLG